MSKVVVMDHPLIEQKIGIIRRKETGTKDFRQNISEIAMLIGYEATKDLPLEEVEIETPMLLFLMFIAKLAASSNTPNTMKAMPMVGRGGRLQRHSG